MTMKPTFDLTIARALAIDSQLAYSSGLGSCSDDRATYHEISNPQTDIHAVLIQRRDFNVLAFRGTHSLENWMTDAQVGMVELGLDGGMIHRGFQAAYLSVDSLVQDELGRAPDVPLWIAGHSLGAALACICAGYLAWYHGARWLDAIAGIYAFGCPLWCNKAGAQTYDRLLGDRTWRVTHALDPVPHIPRFGTSYGQLYWKTSGRVWITDDGQCIVNASWWRVLPQAVRCAWNEERRGELEPIPDHGIQRYIDALNTAKL